MKAIGYFSVRDRADVDDVLSGQLQAFSTYCQRHIHQPVETFVDYDLDDGEHPRYRDMLAYLRQSDSEFLVIIAGSQHLGNTLESFVRRVLELDAQGAKVICNDEELPDPLQQALKYWHSTKSGSDRGERIKEAMKAKAIRGEGLGKPPFGYKIGSKGKLEIVPGEGAIVRLIFNLYTNENIGMRRIVHYLNEKETPTRSGRGWSIVTVRDILRNRSYLGTYIRFGMRVPRSHEAIIDSDEFNVTQEKMAHGRTPRVMHASEPFLLSTFVYCASCGNRMIGVSRRQGWSRKDGSRTVGQYRYYQCQSRTNQGMCSYHTWRSDILEKMVLSHAKEALESGDAKLHLSEALSRRSNDAEKNVERLNAQFLRAFESAAAGVSSLERLRSTLEDVDAERDTLAGRVLHEGSLLEVMSSGDSSSLLQRWDSLDTDTARHVLRALVSRVSVGDDEVELIFHTEEQA
jgi:site-specific DNA recombinase